MPSSDIPILAEQHQEEEIIGQPRALQALQMATGVRAKGFNLFVMGYPGTGRYTAVKKILSEYTSETSDFEDIAYVYNFSQPEHPKILYFPGGRAIEFKRAVHHIVENLKTIIRAKMESKSFKEQKQERIDVIENHENRVLAEFESELNGDNFEIIQIDDDESKSSDIVPLWEGKRTSFHELQNRLIKGEIRKEEWNNLREKYYSYMDRMKEIFKELRNNRMIMEEELEALKAEVIKPDVHIEIERILGQYQDPEIIAYLSALEQDILEHIYLFTSEKTFTDELGNPRLIRYGVNVLVDSSRRDSVPIIYENHPTYTNLFGSIETIFERGGEVRTSFMMIRPGALINASGGFVVLRAEDLFQEPNSWFHLKRVLLTGELEIQQMQPYSSVPGPSMKPEPIRIDTKIVIIGREYMYDFLYKFDPDFQKHFKIAAEFDTEMPRTEENTAQYIHFILRKVREAKLLQISHSGIAAVIEYAVRLSEHKERLTTRFSFISDLLIESDYWAKSDKKETIDHADVDKAVDKKGALSNLIEEKLDDMIRSGEIAIQLSGSYIGRINGLGVYDRGYYAFGRPIRISAQIAPGEDGVVNIEREAGFSEESHDKGVLIIEGFLRSRYARSFPLSLYGSICVDQSYGEIDGDSASSAELFTLLSALSGLPLRQDIAVTGSVNQMGEMLAVGGIIEKVEGFYRICKKTGLTGKQGVVVPVGNIPNLVLSKEVSRAVEEETFSVYAVSTVDEGMEVLTGRKAGVRSGKGLFPDKTINALVEKNLKLLADRMRLYTHN